MSYRYRPEIDGLRAVAVLAVLIFHLDTSLLSGGYAGVDVFFVLSGYLITRNTIQNQEPFSIAHFSAKRIARLAPASAFVAITSGIIALLSFLPGDRREAGNAIFASSLWATNLLYSIKGDYFAQSADSELLVHYWSLATEEQFYVLFAIAALLGSLSKSIKAVILTGGILVTGSMGAASMLSPESFGFYYLLHTRAWQILAGVMLAIAMRRENAIFPRPLARTLSACSLIALLATFLLHDSTSGYPGPRALAPVASTIILLLCTDGDSTSPIRRGLSLPPIRHIGLLSYSLYLWHWPVICIYRYHASKQESRSDLIAMTALTYTLAALSYRFIERPLRRKLSSNTSAALIVGALLVLAQASTAVLLRVNSPTPATMGMNPIKQALDYPFAQDWGTRYGQGSTRIALVGDSHASMIAPTLIGSSYRMNFTLEDYSLAGSRFHHQSPTFRQTLNELENSRPDIIFVSCFWSRHFGGDAGMQDLRALVQQLQPHTGQIVLLGESPVAKIRDPRQHLRQTGNTTCAIDHSLHTVTPERLDSLLGGSITVINANAALKTERGEIKLFDDSGLQIYRDADHLTEYGSSIFCEPALRVLSAIIEQ